MKKKLRTSSQLFLPKHNFKQFKVTSLNKAIEKYAYLFIQDPALLRTARLQTPLEKNNDISAIKQAFGSNVYRQLLLLNRIYRLDEKILKNPHRYKDIILLFLVSLKVCFDKMPFQEIQKKFNQRDWRYFMKLLQTNDVGELRITLEDRLFSLLEPQVYKNYYSLLKFTQKNFASRQKKILRGFQRMMKEARIFATLESRLKTIYSIHNKITKKNILLSQILDTIGVRIIVDNEEDCYRSMACILKKYPIITSRVKDFIAVPKPNGYQSIHLTIFYDNQPVEIQIRTHQMHQEAQYGVAAHNEYKKSK